MYVYIPYVYIPSIFYTHIVYEGVNNIHSQNPAFFHLRYSRNMLRRIETTPVGSWMNTWSYPERSTCLRSTDMHQYTDMMRFL